MELSHQHSYSNYWPSQRKITSTQRQINGKPNPNCLQHQLKLLFPLINSQYLIRSISTKYYDAKVHLHLISLDLKQLGASLKKLETIQKKEAFIYYFDKEDDLTEQYYNVIENIQENYGPEISLLFFNGKPQLFKRAAEQIIDKCVQNHFIEYLKQDLSELQADIKDKEEAAVRGEQIEETDAAAKKSTGIKGGLLNGEDKVGMDRLVEAMHCCMWSNMRKKKIEMNQVSQTLINDL